jgi:putative peptidoglycan lipid II flippase
MTNRLARSAGVIGLATLTSRLLGLVRDVAIGVLFGTSMAADAYAVATRFPMLLRDLFAEGAMSAAFVPTFTRYLQREGKEAAWRLGAQVINALLVVTGVLVVAGILLAEPLVELYADGFKDTPGKLELTIQLARVTMPFLLLVAVAAAFMGMLNALRHFVIPASSPALFNVVFIIATAALVPVFERYGVETALALAFAMLLGGLVQIVVQWPTLRREGYRHRWLLNWRDSGLREVLFLMGPGSIGVAAAQINLLVNTQLATDEGGAASALGYAFRLMYMPIGILGVSIATAAIPDLVRHAQAGSHAQMRTTLSWGLRLMLMLSVPATLGLMVLAHPIVELIFEHGKVFGPESTSLVAAALLYYAPGIVGYSVVKLASPSFYSLQDSRTPMVVSLITIAANLGLNLWLNSIMGFTGLALGTAIAANVNAGLLLWLLAKRIDGIEARRVLWSLLKITVASLVMALVAYELEAWLRTTMPGGSVIYRALRVILSIGAGMGALALSAWALRIDEFHQAMARLLSRFKG